VSTTVRAVAAPAVRAVIRADTHAKADIERLYPEFDYATPAMTVEIVTQVIAELLNLRAVLTPAAARSVRTVGPVVIRGYRAVDLSRVGDESDSLFLRHPRVFLPEVGDRQLGAIVAEIEIPADLVGVFQNFRDVPTDAIRPHIGQKVLSSSGGIGR
jgi:hypothetical protein